MMLVSAFAYFLESGVSVSFMFLQILTIPYMVVLFLTKQKDGIVLLPQY